MDEDLPFFYRMIITYESPRIHNATYIFPADHDMLGKVWHAEALGALSHVTYHKVTKILLEEVYITSSWTFEFEETKIGEPWEKLLADYGQMELERHGKEWKLAEEEGFLDAATKAMNTLVPPRSNSKLVEKI